MNCPHCKKELTESQVKSLYGAWRGSVTSEKKKASSAENGRKGGRPKKIIL